MNLMRSVDAQQLVKAGALTIPLLWASAPVGAEELTSRVVLQKFNSEQFASYTAGMVEGFAYARYLADGESTDAMQCIYQWYYADNKQTLLSIMAGFAEYGDATPGAVISGLITKECGE